MVEREITYLMMDTMESLKMNKKDSNNVRVYIKNIKYYLKIILIFVRLI